MFLFKKVKNVVCHESGIIVCVFFFNSVLHIGDDPSGVVSHAIFHVFCWGTFVGPFQLTSFLCCDVCISSFGIDTGPF